ncbi:hypothetical protein Tco_0588009 [Tanacetum coccineum]
MVGLVFGELRDPSYLVWTPGGWMVFDAWDAPYPMSPQVRVPPLRKRRRRSFESHPLTHLVFEEPGLGKPELGKPELVRTDQGSSRGFVLRSLELHILSFIIGIEYPNLID